MSYLSLTSWSLHRSLGPLHMTHWDAELQTQVTEDVEQPSRIELHALPDLAAERGIEALDICHFHFPNTSAEYLHRLREAFVTSNVTFRTLLVDYGDISSHDEVRRLSDVRYIEHWIDIAATVGAKCIRVVSGESDCTNAEALELAAASLRQLVDYAQPRGVRIFTENFRALSATPDNCLYLLQACDNRLGLIADFGNFKSEQKYADLARILPHAENVHAKADYDDHGFPNVTEFQRCMKLLKPANYNGPITIVYDGPGDEWEGIARVQSILNAHLASTR